MSGALINVLIENEDFIVETVEIEIHWCCRLIRN